MFMIYINKFVGARIFAQARDTTKVADNGLPNYAINNDVKRVKKVENRVYLQTRNSGLSLDLFGVDGWRRTGTWRVVGGYHLQGNKSIGGNMRGNIQT